MFASSTASGRSIFLFKSWAMGRSGLKRKMCDRLLLDFLPDKRYHLASELILPTAFETAVPCPYNYSRFHVYEVHPDCSSIAVGTRQCRVPTSIVYLTNLKSAVGFRSAVKIHLLLGKQRFLGMSQRRPAKMN